MPSRRGDNQRDLEEMMALVLTLLVLVFFTLPLYCLVAFFWTEVFKAFW
jgi:hypothetical protein